MTRQPLSGLVLRQYDDHAWWVHGRTTDVLLGQVIGAAGDWKAYTAFSDTPHTGRTRTEALRAAWPDLTPPREPS